MRCSTGWSEAVRGGESRALVVRGEPGVGKTALLEYVDGQASGFRVARAAGVQSEMELAFAGVHQLCAPMLDRLERLPVPQRDALRTALGISAGTAPDRFLVALAVLGLLSDVAEQRPLICLVDDEQWLDRASAQVLAFVARRLQAESVGVVFGGAASERRVGGTAGTGARGSARGGCAGTAGLGASRAAGRAGPRPHRRRDARQPAGAVGAAARVDAGGIGGRVRFAGAVRSRGASRRASGGGWRSSGRDPAAGAGGGGRTGRRTSAGVAGSRAARDRGQAATPAAEAGLLEFGARVLFRHPLVRSVAYRSASLSGRQEVHRALAEATDPELDPDRRAWHRAHAAPGPDEEVAEELERSAGRAQARGGLAAAAAFLERAAMLTREPARRAERLLAAARAKRDAGAFDAALGLLVAVEAGPLDPVQAVELQRLRGQIAMMQRRGSDAARLLLERGQTS